MSASKKGAKNKPTDNKIAVFNSRPFQDYQMLETAVMSIVSNKYDVNLVTLLLCLDNPSTAEHLAQVAQVYNLKTATCATRKELLSKMTDMLVFCHPTDRALFQELVPYRDRGTQMYLVVQE